jgi:hypothetical protein
MPQRLEVLKGLSEDEQLRTYVRELDFGPEVLNTNLEVDLQYVREQWEEPSTGCPHPESYIYVDSARPICRDVNNQANQAELASYSKLLTYPS